MSDIKMEVTGERQLGAFVRHVYRNDIPFATSSAINRTALDFQETQREHMGEEFTIRRRQFMERSVKVKPFARKTRLEAKVSIDSPAGRSDIFGKFEEGGTKRAKDGSVAVPGPGIRRTKSGVIRKRSRPRALIDSLQMRPIGRRRVFSGKGTGVWVGRRGTFMIRKSGNRGGIFKRFGPGRGDYEALYIFTPSVEIEDSLNFVENATKVVEQKFPRNFSKAFDRAMRTSRR